MKDNLSENWITCAIDTDYVERVFKIDTYFTKVMKEIIFK